MTQSLDIQSLPLPPGPRGLPIVGVVPHLLRDIYGYLPQIAREYGDVVQLRVPGPKLILLNHPDHVNHIMTRHAARYWKGKMNHELIDGEAYIPMPLADGEQWKRVRRLLNPKFGERSMQELSRNIVGDITRHLDETWERAANTGESFDLESNVAAMALSLLLRGGMSLKLDNATVDEISAAMRTYSRYVGARMLLHSMPSRIPRPFARSGRRAKEFLYGFIDRVIDERLADPGDSIDILTLLLEARFDDGNPMTREELRGEIISLIFGGQETTSTAFAWTFALLAQHPAAVQRARAQIAELDLAERNPEFADLARLPFVRACFDEGMRVQGAPMFARSPLQDDAIGGYRIPKDAIVIVSPTVLHKDPRFWTDPDKYNPARFETDTIDKNAFIPFNVGQRKCMGYRMAYMEATFAIAMVLHRYNLHIPEGFELHQSFRASTGIKGGVPLRVTHREGDS